MAKIELQKFEHKLVVESDKDNDRNIFEGDSWKCDLSPIGRCVYTYDGGDYCCIYCGEPEERK